MYYITILDYANGSVDQYNLGQIEADNIENWQTGDFEDFLISEGYSLKNNEWMSHSDDTINKF